METLPPPPPPPSSAARRSIRRRVRRPRRSGALAVVDARPVERRPRPPTVAVSPAVATVPFVVAVAAFVAVGIAAAVAAPSETPRLTREHDFFEALASARESVERVALVSRSAEGIPYRSAKYTFDGFYDALFEMGTAGVAKSQSSGGIDFGGGGGFGVGGPGDSDSRFVFYLGNEERNLDYGWANVAAFLANVMVESIREDACSEVNVEESGGRYALSNACGQNGRSYQDEICDADSDGGVDYACGYDPTSEFVASDAPAMISAPPPFECRERTGAADSTGYWDAGGGRFRDDVPYSNGSGRTDLEGCCWWGRGALSTRGPCDIGKLNFYLGARAANEGRTARFPDVDFCAFPGATCTRGEDIRWITGMFEWMERVQTYSGQGVSGIEWSYVDELKKFVDGGGMDDPSKDASFIDAVSSIVTRRRHDESRSNLGVPFEEERRDNFRKLLEGAAVTHEPTRFPTRKPTAVVDPPKNAPAPTVLPPPSPSPKFLSPPPSPPPPSPPTSPPPPPPPAGENEASTPWPTRLEYKVIPVDGSAAPGTNRHSLSVAALTGLLWMSSGFAFG